MEATARKDGGPGAAVPPGDAREDHLGDRRASEGSFPWGLALLGFSGSLAMTVVGPQLVDGRATRWWFRVDLGAQTTTGRLVLYLGLVALLGAWAGVGLRLGRAGGGTRQLHQLWAVGALWALPLLVAPALFSQDMYSYLAQGAILHLGLDPYRVTPLVLARHGEGRLLAAVSPFWRTTTAPYGPVFLGIVGLFVGSTGTHLVADIVAARLLELVGIVLLAVFVPRLAGALGADPLRATWLAAASPLVLVELLAAGHNDALMAGLMVAGVALAVERHPLWGVALCALAATVKLPALAAVVFIAAARLREPAPPGSRARFSAAAAAIVLAVLGSAGAATGVGTSWLSLSVLAAPGKVHLSITPATALGWCAAAVLHALGVAVDAKHLENVMVTVGTVVIVLVGCFQLWRSRGRSFVPHLGWALLVAAFAGPAAWPWYFTWGLVLLAAWPATQRSALLVLLAAPVVLLVQPNGILLLPLQAAPAVLGIYVVLALTVLVRRRLGHRSVALEATGS